MTENTLLGRLLKQLRTDWRSAIIFKHADRFRHGVPDVSITADGVTSWWEAKWANPTFDSPGIQQLTMKRLAAHTPAYYVIFCASRQLYIVSPEHLDQWRDATLYYHEFDFDWLAAKIRELHRRGVHA